MLGTQDSNLPVQMPQPLPRLPEGHPHVWSVRLAQASGIAKVAVRWQIWVFLVWMFYLVICNPLVQIPYWLFPLPLSPQDCPSLLYPVTLGTVQTQFSVASWLQVKLCQ